MWGLSQKLPRLGEFSRSSHARVRQHSPANPKCLGRRGAQTTSLAVENHDKSDVPHLLHPRGKDLRSPNWVFPRDQSTNCQERDHHMHHLLSFTTAFPFPSFRLHIVQITAFTCRVSSPLQGQLRKTSQCFFSFESLFYRPRASTAFLSRCNNTYSQNLEISRLPGYFPCICNQVPLSPLANDHRRRYGKTHNVPNSTLPKAT